MLEHARELGFDAQRCGFRRMPTPPAASIAQNSALLPQPEPPSAALHAAEATVTATAKAVAPRPPIAKTGPVRTQATRADMQHLLALLDGLASLHRPARKDALLVLLQSWLCESSARSPRTLHALAQLQARKRVVLKGEAVSYPPVEAAQTMAKTPANKAAAPKAGAAKNASASKAPAQPPVSKKSAASAPPKALVPAAGKTSATQPPTAAQVARAVLVSLLKMTTNKPRQRSGLLQHIQTHAARAEDPAAMAQRVLSLLEARKDVVTASDGKRVTYLKLE